MCNNTSEDEHWMSKTWRPLMAMSYMIICLFDFMLGPILYNILQYLNPGQAVGMWQSLTLQGGGLYHLAMGAIIGVSAYGRTQEKLNTPAPSADPTPSPVINKPVMNTPAL